MAAAVALCAVGVASGGTASPPRASAALAGRDIRVASDCRHQRYHPRLFVVACADGGFYLSRLRWRSWSNRSALARGTAHANDCAPDCAHGRFHTYPAVLKLDHPGYCSSRGDYEFKRFSVSLPRGKPPGFRGFSYDVYPSCDG